MPLNYQIARFNNFSGGITDRYLSDLPNRCRDAANLFITTRGTLETCWGFENIIDVGTAYDETDPITCMVSGTDEVFGVKDRRINLIDTATGSLTDLAPQDGSDLFSVSSADVLGNGYSSGSQCVLTQNSGEYPALGIVNREADSDNFTSLTCGLPHVTGGWTVSLAGSSSAGSMSYAYVVALHIDYTVDGRSYKMVSPVSDIQSELKTQEIATDYGLNISIPAAALPAVRGNNTKYTLSIYRTVKNGSVFYKAYSTEVDMTTPTNPFINEVDTTQYVLTDEMTDDTLSTNQSIYTTGGNVDIYPAPKCRYAFLAGSVPYFAAALEDFSSVENVVSTENRVYQGIPGTLWGTGSSFFVELEEPCVGGGSINGIPVVFTKSKTYRIDGKLLSNGTGSMRAVVISDGIGCISHNSITSNNYGLFFASEQGFYQTDGYKVTPVAADTHERYSDTIGLAPVRYAGVYDTSQGVWNGSSYEGLGDADRVAGSYYKVYVPGGGSFTDDNISVTFHDGRFVYFEDNYDSTEAFGSADFSQLVVPPSGFFQVIAASDDENSRVFWSVSSREMWVLNMITGGFTTMYADDFFDSKSLAVHAGSLYRGDRRGGLYSHNKDAFSYAKKVDDSWINYGIPYRFLSLSHSLGGDAITKWGYGLNLETKIDIGGVGMKTYVDENTSGKDIKGYSKTNSTYWGDTFTVWGDDLFSWGSSGFVSIKRRFPRGALRFKRRQIEITPEEMTVLDGNMFGPVSVVLLGTDSEDNGALEVTLQDANAFWPEDSSEYSFTIVNDDGVIDECAVIRQDQSDTQKLIVFASTDFIGTTDSWTLKGKLKEQKQEIIGYSVRYAPLSNEGGEYNQGDDLGR